MKIAMVLCRLDEIALPGSRGFCLGAGARRREIFVVRGAEGVWANENSCPHTGGMLDWVPAQLLSYEQTHIHCATHGALFRLEDGHCVHGPCLGKSLVSVVIKLQGGNIVLVDEAI